MEFHPFAEDYPLMPAYELGRLEEAMRERGFDPRFPVVLYEGKVLDGRNRWICAERAGVKPKTVEFKGTEEEARRFVITANEERRHLNPIWLKERREERIARVVDARQEGHSLRAIAEQEGVSESQVREDLKKASTAQGCAVEPEEGAVTGRDGRTRTATPDRPPPILCERCKRVGARKGCEACKEARKAARGKKQPEGLSEEAAGILKKHKAKTTAEQLEALARYSDDTQISLAESVAEKKQTLEQAVATGEVPDPTVEETIKEVNGRIESFCRKLTEFANQECPDDFWLSYQGRRDVFFQKVKDCCSQLRGGKCHAVCPKCDGAGCSVCVKTGRLPRLQYDQVA